MLRKTRQAQTAVTAGTPLAQALADNGLEEPQFMELLAAESAANPSFGWLREQLLRERRLRETEDEIARLNRAVSDQSREISELRDRLAHKA
jgi:predicted RNase H-like nuclease (RuvC/YqgF family)